MFDSNRISLTAYCLSGVRAALRAVPLFLVVGCGSSPDPAVRPAPGEGLEAAGNALQLAAPYRLPEACATDDRAGWDAASGSWRCVAGVRAGPGLAVEAGLIVVAAGARLPIDCGEGALPIWDGAAWNCGVPSSDGDLLAALRCTSGQVPKRVAGSWACAADEDTRAEGGVGVVIEGNAAILPPAWRLPRDCAAGQLPQWLGTDWGCGDDRDADADTLATLVCTPGDTLGWDGAAWRCTLDTDRLPIAGNGLVAAGRALSLAPSFTLPTTCADGQVPSWAGAGWVCADDRDTQGDPDLLATLACATGAVPRWNGVAWACGTAPQYAGEGLDLVGGVLGLQASDTLPQLCASGQIGVWNAGEWSCGDDGTITGVVGEEGLRGAADAGAATVELDLAFTDAAYEARYRRTVVVSPVGTPLDNGAALMTAVSAVAAAAPSATTPWLIHLEPGLYDVGNATLTFPGWVVVEGAGTRQTVIRAGGTTAVAFADTSGAPRARNELRALRLEHPVSTAASPRVETVRIAEREVRIAELEIDTRGIGIATTAVALHSGSLELDRTFIQCSGATGTGTVIGLDAMAPVSIRGGSIYGWTGQSTYAARLRRAATIDGTRLVTMSSWQSAGVVVNDLADEVVHLRNALVRSTEALKVDAAATARVTVEHAQLLGDSASVAAVGGTVELSWTQTSSPVVATGSAQVSCFESLSARIPLDVDCSWL